MTLVATQVKRRRGTTAENDAFTGAEGEIVVDTERHELRVHDGATQGGFKIGGDKANITLDNLTNAGKKIIAHNAMPSNRYVNLTLGASWASYTAPSDGYVVIRKNSTAANQYIKIINRTSETSTATTSPHSSYDICVTLPVSKGDSFQVAYNADGTTNYFRFVYANGAS